MNLQTINPHLLAQRSTVSPPESILLHSAQIKQEIGILRKRKSDSKLLLTETYRMFLQGEVGLILEAAAQRFQ